MAGSLALDCPACRTSQSAEPTAGNTYSCARCGATMTLPHLPDPADRGVRSRSHSGLAVFAVFFLVFAGCAALVVWLVTRPFREADESSAAKVRQARESAVAAPPAWHPAPPVVLTTEPLEDVRAVAVSSEGAAWVAQYQRLGQVYRLDAGSAPAPVFRLAAETPVQALVAAAGTRLFVLQGGQVRQRDGAAAGTGRPVRLAVAPDGGVRDIAGTPDGGLVAYVATTTGDRLVWCDAAGKVIRRVDLPTAGHLDGPSAQGQIAASGDGDVWLLSGFNSPAILHFSANGAYLSTIPAGKSRPTQFTVSAQIAVDAAGRVLVTGREGIIVFRGDGTHVATLPVEGARDLAFAPPASVVVTTLAGQVVTVALPPAEPPAR